LKSALYIYENYKDFSKNKDFKKYILNIKSDIIFEEEEEEEQNYGNLNLEELNKIENMSNLSNINVGNYLQNNSKQKFKNVGPIMDLDLIEKHLLMLLKQDQHHKNNIIIFVQRYGIHM
jgi:hypothetical protein